LKQLKPGSPAPALKAYSGWALVRTEDVEADVKRLLLNPVPVSSQVGHCDFTAGELFGALAVLQQAMEGPVL